MPTKLVHLINGFVLNLGKRHYIFADVETPFNSCSSSMIALDKYRTNKLLATAGIPVPKAIYANANEFKADKLGEKLSHLKFPLVIKPLRGAQGIDVLCNIQTVNELNAHLAEYFAKYDELIIEEFHGKLKSYRVLVFKRKVIGVVLCHPAHVVGDGKHNLKELIDLENINRKNPKNSDLLGPIIIDEESHIRLRELGVDIDYIPVHGERVVIAYTSNGTRGGTYESLAKKICKENRELMIRAADIVNLNLTGIDVECADIQQPLVESNGVVLELNSRPCVQIHELPTSGASNLVTKKIMKSFIFRHPLAYLYLLYTNKKTGLYLRSLILISVMIGLMLIY